MRRASANFYGYRLAEGDEAAIARIVAFFPHCGRAGLERAMAWAKQDIEYTFDLERNKGDNGAFASLIRPRENFVRHGKPQAVFADQLRDQELPLRALPLRRLCGERDEELPLRGQLLHYVRRERGEVRV